MDRNEIGINNFVEVTIAKSQPPLAERNINSVGIFTRDTNIQPLGEYVVYKDSSSALADWGVDSMTYRVVNTIFSQSPNVNTGNGKVYVFKLRDNVTVPATHAFVEFKNLIVDNFRNLNPANGDITIQFGTDTPIAIANIDFTGVRTIEDIASIISKVLEDDGIDDVVVTTIGDNIHIARMELGLSTVPLTLTGTLAAVDYLNASGAVYYHGSDEYTGVERLQDAMARVGESVFYEVALPVFDETDDNLKASSDFIGDKPQMLTIVKSNPSYLESGSLFDNVRVALQTKTRCLYYGNDENKFIFASAYLGNWLTANFNGSNTLRNLHAKSLTGILPDGTISQTLLDKAQTVGADVYVSTGGIGAVFCSGRNEWFDTQYALNALQINLENVSFSTLRVGNKVAQTSTGIALFENAYRSVCLAFAKAGFITAGERWTLPFSFGDPEDFDTAIQEYGVYIYTDSLAEQLPENRSLRLKPTSYIAVKLAGAFNRDFVYIIKND
ncbi:hypothetical protein FACS1894152_1660 [Bacilli bacterium]|nr:hypothetical protein FACS1894152_1660 [Bacilli bacterium]